MRVVAAARGKKEEKGKRKDSGCAALILKILVGRMLSQIWGILDQSNHGMAHFMAPQFQRTGRMLVPSHVQLPLQEGQGPGCVPPGETLTGKQASMKSANSLLSPTLPPFGLSTVTSGFADAHALFAELRCCLG